jgi:hypothetical protein
MLGVTGAWPRKYTRCWLCAHAYAACHLLQSCSLLLDVCLRLQSACPAPKSASPGLRMLLWMPGPEQEAKQCHAHNQERSKFGQTGNRRES